MITTDWRKLHAGRELDRVIAEKLGWVWTCVYQTKYATYVTITKPDGTILQNVDAYGSRPEWPEYEAVDLFPQYSTDLNLAYALFDGRTFWATLQMVTDVRKNHRYYRVWACDGPHSFEVEHEADTPSLALCYAWLECKEKVYKME